MRKYLLLATVAGCMVSTCAFAGGSIATDKQSAVINVKANIKIADELKNLQDMNFGTLYVLSGTTGDLVSIDTTGVVTTISSGVVATRGTALPGAIEKNQDAYYDVTCADGTGDPIWEGDSCSLGNGLVLKNVIQNCLVSAGYSCKSMVFGGTLSATEAVTQAKNVDAPGIKVEMRY